MIKNIQQNLLQVGEFRRRGHRQPEGRLPQEPGSGWSHGLGLGPGRLQGDLLPVGRHLPPPQDHQQGPRALTPGQVERRGSDPSDSF